MNRPRRMRNLLGLAATAVLLCSAANAQTLHLPPHEKVVLKNGLTVLLLEKHGVPLINISALVKAGSAADPAGEDGLAAITAGMLRKGTQNRSAQKFAADYDFIGGTLDAEASPDFTEITAEFMTKDLARGLDLFCDALLHPTFPQDEIDKLLAQALDGVKAVKDDPRQATFPYYFGYLYGAHPYGRAANGDEVSLKQIHRDTIVKFYETNYVPGNTIVAMAGEFNAVETRAKLEESLGAWPSRAVKPATIPNVTTVRGKRLLLVNKPDATQTYFAIGNTGESETDPDRIPIEVVNTIFGGRFTSQLNEALRVESGYTYGAEAFFLKLRLPGPFAIFSFTKNETTTQAIDLALQVLDKLHHDGVTAEQLKSAKAYIKGQSPPEIETSKQLAQIIARHEFYGLRDDEINHLEALIDAVTPETARQTIQKHFPADNLVFVLIGNASVIAQAVKKYAPNQDAREISDLGFWPAPSSAATVAK